MPEIKKKRVGILRGGIENNYHSSLRQGGDIILHLLENLNHKYKTLDILIDKNGVWHCNGLPIIPTDLFHKVDVVWNATHPSMSMLLDNLSIPNIGSSSFSSLLEKNKEMLRAHMKSVGVSMARHIVLPVYQKDFDGPREKYAIKKAKEVFEKFSAPWLVQSLTQDTNMAVHLAKTFPELIHAIEDGVEHNTSIVVEEFIVGKVAFVHSLTGFRGEDVYVFPPINIFGSISMADKNMLIDLVRGLHKHVNANTYLKTGFVIDKRGKIYLSHINSTPDLSNDSYYLSQVCESVGADIHHIVDHMLESSFMVK